MTLPGRTERSAAVVRGFIALLTPEQGGCTLEYTGPDHFGDVADMDRAIALAEGDRASREMVQRFWARWRQR